MKIFSDRKVIFDTITIYLPCGAWALGASSNNDGCEEEPVIWWLVPDGSDDERRPYLMIGLCEKHKHLPPKFGMTMTPGGDSYASSEEGIIRLTDEEATIYLVMAE